MELLKGQVINQNASRGGMFLRRLLVYLRPYWPMIAISRAALADLNDMATNKMHI